MPIRLFLPSLALIAAAGSVALAQVPPSKAARSFTLDGLAPSPSPTVAASPQASASPAPDASAAAPMASATAAGPGVGSAPVPVLAAPVIPENVAVAASPAIRAVFTLDTPIQDLIANPGAKAVLDKDLPGMSDDENLDKFKMLSLRSLQPQTGGQLTDAMLGKVASDLDVLGGGSGTTAMPAPIRAGTSKRNLDGSR